MFWLMLGILVFQIALWSWCAWHWRDDTANSGAMYLMGVSSACLSLAILMYVRGHIQ